MSVALIIQHEKHKYHTVQYYDYYYYYLWPVWFHHIFPHYLINSRIFGRKLLNTKCVFWFSLQLLFELFLILRTQPNIITNVHRSSPKHTHYSCQISMKLGLFDRFLKKSSNIKFYENLPSSSGTVPCGQTDRQTWQNSELCFTMLQSHLWN
jgi:hypothetical protein